MTLLKLDHVQLAIPAGGEGLAREFYGGLLGLAEIPKPETLESRGGCWFRIPGADLHLGVDPDFRAAQKAHPAFLVSDLARLSARFERAGVAYEIDASVPGVHRLYTSDPFGNRIELIQEGAGLT